MRVLILSLLLFLGTHCDIKATPLQSKRCDASCVRVVKRLLEESALGISTSYGEKQNYRLGDKVAVALLKIHNGREIVKPENIKVFLPIIKAAFRYPDLISSPEDRTPAITLRLLRNLESKVKDSSLQKQIAETINLLLEIPKTR